jgi:hypothetical protein
MKKQTTTIFITTLVLCTFMLSTCMGVKSEIWISDGGSGRIQMEYRMPRILIEGLKESEYGETIVVCDGVEIPGHFSEDHIRDELRDGESLTLSDHQAWQQGEDVLVCFEIEFSNIEDLMDIDMIPQIELWYDDETVVFEQVVCGEFGLDPGDPEAVQLYKDYTNSFTVHAPRRIVFHNKGELSQDGKTLGFEYSLLSTDECRYAGAEEEDDKLRVEW